MRSIRAKYCAVAAAACAALLYYLFWDGAAPTPAGVIVKSLCALLLAAALFLDHRYGPLPVIVMVFYAAGNALVATEATDGGFGFAFAIGHIAALSFFAGNGRPRDRRAIPQRLAAWAIALSAIPLARLAGDGDWPQTLFLALTSGMAAFAWLSRFTRYQTGIGAVLVLASIVLAYFMRFGGVAAVQPFIWPIYAIGIVLMTLGMLNGPRFPRHAQPTIAYAA